MRIYAGSNLSVAHVCKQLGIDAGALSVELKKRGIGIRKPTPDALFDEMVRLYETTTMTVTECASRFGKNKGTLLAELKRRGVAVRTVSPEERGRKSSATRQGVPLHEWKGHTVRLDKRGWSHPDYKAWRASVFNRDNFTCADCEKGGRLNAHHIFRVKSFPHLALQIGNGITLCEKCHKAIRGKEQQHAPRYLAKIKSTLAPLPLLPYWPDDPRPARKRKPKQLSLF